MKQTVPPHNADSIAGIEKTPSTNLNNDTIRINSVCDLNIDSHHALPIAFCHETLRWFNL